MLTFRPIRFLYTIIVSIIGVHVCGWWCLLFIGLAQLDFELKK